MRCVIEFWWWKLRVSPRRTQCRAFVCLKWSRQWFKTWRWSAVWCEARGDRNEQMIVRRLHRRTVGHRCAYVDDGSVRRISRSSIYSWTTCKRKASHLHHTSSSSLPRQNEYQLSGWVIIINGDGGCRFWQPVQADSQPKSSGLVLGRRPLGAVLHSSNEPGEFSQWLCHDDSTINIVLYIIILKRLTLR